MSEREPLRGGPLALRGVISTWALLTGCALVSAPFSREPLGQLLWLACLGTLALCAAVFGLFGGLWLALFLVEKGGRLVRALYGWVFSWARPLPPPRPGEVRLRRLDPFGYDTTIEQTPGQLRIESRTAWLNLNLWTSLLLGLPLALLVLLVVREALGLDDLGDSFRQLSLAPGRLGGLLAQLLCLAPWPLLFLYLALRLLGTTYVLEAERGGELVLSEERWVGGTRAQRFELGEVRGLRKREHDGPGLAVKTESVEAVSLPVAESCTSEEELARLNALFAELAGQGRAQP